MLVRRVRMTLTAGLRTELRPLPGLLQTLALVPLPQSAVEDLVRRAVRRNPLLEWAPVWRCSGCARTGGGCGCSRPGSAPYRDPVVDPFGSLAVAAACELHAAGRAALPVVLEYLDGRCVLTETPDRIAGRHGLPPAAVAEAVRAIRSAGPPGVAELSLTDQLVAQAAALAAAGSVPAWLPSLVAGHLPDLAAGRAEAVALALGVSTEQARAAFRTVQERLRPLTGVGPVDAGPAGAQASSAPPDVFVYRAPGGDGYSIEVPGARGLGLRLLGVQPDLAADPQARAWLAPHEAEARQLLHQLDTRAATIRRVAAEVVRCQAVAIRGGSPAMNDLTRRQVADRLGVHPSTVSRAVADKVLRRPDGELVQLADLFGTGMAAKAALRAVAATGPRSDSELAVALRAAGHDLARRTVAKYRAELGIPAAGRPA